jgi:phosphate transport system protein
MEVFMLQSKLNELKKTLIMYAGVIESMFSKTITGLNKKDKSILDEVFNKDEKKSNNYEIELDEMCTNFIAQYQPAAKDLRIILMVMKINSDLERVGDHCVNIVESAKNLIEKNNIDFLNDLNKMAEITINMLKDSINSFVKEDSILAKDVCSRDNLVDDLKDKITEEMKNVMINNNKNIDTCLHVLRIAGNLERIADLSTNVGEDVMFMVEGKVIKHHKDENIK